MTTESADYCMLVYEWAWSKVIGLLIKAGSGHGLSFGIRDWAEMGIRCVKGMHMLKVVSCDKILGFKGRRLKDIYMSYLIEAQNLSPFLFILGLIPGGGLVFFH